ncbi:MAG: gamma-glutamyltransferase [Alphaproteobacteria bacterium]|nr:gamma-glutamyltransferase [Alphaproteobacteria bacterium]
MRDFQRPGRSTVLAGNGMAATSHPLATLAALDALRWGGNAVDAAVCAAAVLAVVEPQSTGIGGDCFVLFAPRGSGEIVAYNGSGRAPAAAEVGWYRERGIDAISPNSAHAVTVPGAIEAWARLVSDHGRKGLDDLLQPAITYAEDGYPVHARVAFDWADEVARLAADPNAARIFLPGGAAPKAGDIHRQPELGATLRRIAADGPDGFYRGEVAEDIVGHLRKNGGLHTVADFGKHAGEYVTPIRSSYRGYDVFQCPPNGQGLTVLLMLNLLAGFDLGRMDPLGAERLHLEIEAGRLAYRDRNALIADPAHARVPVAHLLSADYAAGLRDHIRIDRAMTAMPAPGSTAGRDTVYLCVVDSQRNAVSFINSTYWAFGSGLVAPKSGVVLQNRGCGFVLDPNHPNCIAPLKRPFHTIIPGMLVKDGRAIMPFGVMGGSYQPFGHVHLLTNLIDYGMDPQEALDSPRVFHDGTGVIAETGVSDETVAGLARRGHGVARAGEPLGGGQAIQIDWTRGVLTGGSDPRKDGCALGY